MLSQFGTINRQSYHSSTIALIEMRPIRVFSTALLFTSHAHAFIGYGIQMYHPPCAFACGDVIEPAPLSCSVEGHATGHHGHGGNVITTPECRGNDTAFLTTLAWCMKERCEAFNVEAWRLEKYWITKASGDAAIVPKWSWAEAVEAAQTPSRDLNTDEAINGTMTVPVDAWNAEKMSLEEFERQETLHSRFGIVLLVTGFAIPIALTALGYLPFMSSLLEKINPYIGLPSMIGTYHIRPLPYSLGNAPTVGQGLYITILFVLNILLSAVNYRSVSSTWFGSSYQEVLAYVANRIGVLAFALAPLVILFSGRNNILLWCTNWSHSTYMLLHRWVARIFGLQVIVHSLTELLLYQDMGELAAEQAQPYWIWGIVATLAVCIMLVASLLYMRRWSYEAFLIVHIVLAVFVIVGSWYHIEILFERKWNYEQWLYGACAVWSFDRAMRVFRITKIGIRRAKVTEIGSTFVRVDVDGVRWSSQPGYHAYAYFPTIKPLTPWENHPFSVIPTAMLRSHKQEPSSGSEAISGNDSSEDGDVEKSGGIKAATRQIRTTPIPLTAGVSLYIRKSKGRTGWLREQVGLVTLLDGPYTSNPTRQILKCDRLLLIAGGIGITGILPFAYAHLNVKLCWSVKDYAECLVQDLSYASAGIAEKEIRIGQRLDVQALIAQEAEAVSEANSKLKVGVVVCGPGGMCDGVRDMVARFGRHYKSNMVFELEVHAFSW